MIRMSHYNVAEYAQSSSFTFTRKNLKPQIFWGGISDLSFAVPCRNHAILFTPALFSLPSLPFRARSHVGRGDQDGPHQLLVQSVHWQHGRGLPVGEEGGREFEHLGEHGAHVCQDAGAVWLLRMAGGRHHCSRRKFQQYYRSPFVFHRKQNIEFSVVLPPCSSDIHYYRLAPDIRHHCVTALCLVHPTLTPLRSVSMSPRCVSATWATPRARRRCDAPRRRSRRRRPRSRR